MKKFITLTFALILTLTFAACGGNNSSASQNKSADTQTSKPVDLPSYNSPIVGMWRSPSASGSNGPTRGVVFFNADGSYNAMYYIKDRFLGVKGKYKFNNNTLEVYNLSRFERHDNSLSFDNYLGDLKNGWNIIDNGTKNQILEIINPEHPIWQNWGGITGKVGWIEIDNWNETIEWVNNNTIDYPNGLRKPLERVN